MPSAEQFVDGFGVYDGLVIGDYVIVDIKCVERQVQRWNQYEFPIEIKFRWRGYNLQTKSDIGNLQHIFDDYVHRERIIRSNSGRPFICTFNTKNIDLTYTNNTVTLYYLGFAQRTSESNAKNY